MLYCTSRRCALAKAEKVLLIDKYNQYFVEQVNYLHGVPDPSTFLAKPLHTNKSDKDGEEFLRCPDEPYGPPSAEHTYGSFVSRNESIGYVPRVRTFSTRSNKSTLTEDSCIGHDDHKLDSSHVSDCENDADKDCHTSTSVRVETQEPAIGQGDQSQVFVHFSDLNKERVEANYSVRFFENKKVRYIWDDKINNFVKLRGLDKNVSFSQLQKMTQGLSKSEQMRQIKLFGENTIKIEVQSYFRIMVEEVIGPFYIFQVFSCLLWFVDDYVHYAACIVIMSAASLISSVIQIRRNQVQLRDKVGSESYIKVFRSDDQIEEISTSQLTPGDIVAVPTFNTVLQFDGILINGHVIVNESMLTGESVPVTKTPLQLNNKQKNHDFHYDEKEHGKHTLFSGTTVMQTRYYGGVHVKALVIRVGYQTTKGELIRSIMFPRPVDFKFNKQIHKFVGVLAFLALSGFTYSVVLKTHRGDNLTDVLLSAFDMITIVVPPTLPAAMTIGIIYAQSRLRRRKIFCISPRNINISGCINCVCFDKTGTLTEDNLSFNEVVPAIEGKCQFGKPFDETAMQSKSRQIERDNHLLLENGSYSHLMICLASCHSLTIIEGKIVGDPLDLQMFEATGWKLEEPDVEDEKKFDLLAPTVVRPPKKKRLTPLEEDNYGSSDEYPSSTSSSEDNLDKICETTERCKMDVGILRQFPFSSSLQRMTVITRQFSGDQYIVYTKGAPEKIASLCDPKTIPDNFSDVLLGYTYEGFRVLALAYRPLKVGLSYARMQRATRQEVEKDLKFLGLLTLGNLLKPETIPAIKTLKNADIRCVMVTGDNMQTAVSVAKECGMISPSERTVLLEVEKSNSKLAERVKTHPEDKTVNKTEIQNEPLILDVRSAVNLVNNESRPILSQKLREPSRPKLVWHYISNEYKSEFVEELSSKRLKFLDDGPRTHLAVTGDTWDTIIKFYPELVDLVCVRGAVFARMAPAQKQQLVEQLQSLDYYVGMCGDGANDSGALRAAHTGISLSDTEASVAAPFTSAKANISCVPILISEGRAALVTAFGVLKYMALYSLTQFCAILILYTLYTNFTDMEYLYEDLFIITVLVTVFGRTGPYKSLDKKAPSNSLLSIEQLSSVGIQVALVIFFQVLSLVIMWQTSWYVAHPKKYDDQLAGHDNMAIFAMSSFQCISLTIVFSNGKPYRQSILTNRLLIGAIVILTTITIATILLMGEELIPSLYSIDCVMPLDFKFVLVALGVTHLIAALASERIIIDHILFRKQDKFLEIFGFKAKLPAYKVIERSIHASAWPTPMVR